MARHVFLALCDILLMANIPRVAGLVNLLWVCAIQVRDFSIQLPAITNGASMNFCITFNPQR